jgi:O-antigen ligase
MDQRATFLEHSAYYLAFGSAVAALFSIAVCHSLLALAFAALLLSGQRLRLPPVWKPLAAFLGLTVLSLLASQDPLDGRTQIRKFYVYLILLVIYSCFRRTGAAVGLMQVLIAVGTLSALRSLAQFYQKAEQARITGQPFYRHYVADRITGFMSHWMTFAGEMMIIFLVLTAFVLFSQRPLRAPVAWLTAGAIVAAALVLGWTRSIWLATAVGTVYLLWFSWRWLTLALPVVGLLLAWQAPSAIRERIRSIYQPDKLLDSNEHRVLLRRTGWRIILSHPLLGVGPEQVERSFASYIPPDIERPIPAEWWYGHLHNIYIHYAAERGVPALFALLWFFARILVDFRRALRRLPAGPCSERFLLHAGIAVTVGIMVGGWWELNLGDSEVLTLFLTTITCGYLAVDAAGKNDAAQAAEERDVGSVAG